jgi:hypothetical protein
VAGVVQDERGEQQRERRPSPGRAERRARGQRRQGKQDKRCERAGQ